MCSSLSPKSPVVLIHQVVGWGGPVRVGTGFGCLGVSTACSEFRWRLRLSRVDSSGVVPAPPQHIPVCPTIGLQLRSGSQRESHDGGQDWKVAVPAGGGGGVPGVAPP